jgi:hypothetical protein
MLIGSGLQALATSGKFKPVTLGQIRTAGNTGQTARKLIDALQANPGMLVLVIFNMIILLGTLYGVVNERRDKTEIMKSLIERCIVPTQTDR